jgi:hypothetical protein
MEQEVETTRASFPKRIFGGVVLIGAVALLIKLLFHAVVGVFLTIFWVCIGVVALIAVVWALRVIR